jgi:hypothetical protein
VNLKKDLFFQSNCPYAINLDTIRDRKFRKKIPQ